MRSTGGFRLGPPPEADGAVDGADDSPPGRDRDAAPIGILLLDANYAPWQQAPGNAGAFEVPVRCHVVDGCTVDRLIFEGDDGLEEPIVTAARKLVDEGAR